jgi:hypothetical protein
MPACSASVEDIIIESAGCVGRFSPTSVVTRDDDEQLISVIVITIAKAIPDQPILFLSVLIIAILLFFYCRLRGLFI